MCTHNTPGCSVCKTPHGSPNEMAANGGRTGCLTSWMIRGGAAQSG